MLARRSAVILLRPAVQAGIVDGMATCEAIRRSRPLSYSVYAFTRVDCTSSRPPVSARDHRQPFRAYRINGVQIVRILAHIFRIGSRCSRRPVILTKASERLRTTSSRCPDAHRMRRSWRFSLNRRMANSSQSMIDDLRPLARIWSRSSVASRGSDLQQVIEQFECS